VIQIPKTSGFDALDAQGFKVTHDVCDHSLLTRAAIRSLADRLPADSAEIGGGGLVAEGGLDFEATQRVDAAEALDALDGTARSLYLYNVERDPAMGALVSGILAEAYAQTGVDPTQVEKEEGYLFLTGGPTITPTHVDHEYNFLLVLRGRKKVFLAEVPSVEAERALEKMYSGGYGTCARVPDRGAVFEVAAGEGVFIPPRSAHYVVNVDEPCAALSVVFSLRSLVRESAVYRANAALRRFGLHPGPVGRHPVADSAKALAVVAARRVRSSV
jgi:hypothetical protein